MTVADAVDDIVAILEMRGKTQREPVRGHVAVGCHSNMP